LFIAVTPEGTLHVPDNPEQPENALGPIHDIVPGNETLVNLLQFINPESLIDVIPLLIVKLHPDKSLTPL